MPHSIFQNPIVLQRKLGRREMHSFPNFLANVLMNEGNPIGVLNLVALLIFIKTHRKTIAVCIDVVIGGIIGRVILEEKVSVLFDWVVPR